MEAMQSHWQDGFTLTEVIIAVAMLLASGFFVYTQWQYFQMVERNTDRKNAINAMHYYLQEVYLPKHDSYPVVLEPDTITAIKEDALRGPSGQLVTDPGSSLRYQPGGCNGGSCQRYTLRANLEQAPDFIRRSD